MGERRRWSMPGGLRVPAVLVVLLCLGASPAIAGEQLLLEYERGALTVARDRTFPPQADPGKIRREILLAGGGGSVYLMVWDLGRIHPAEWLERALGPVSTGAQTWAPAWQPGADFAAVVEVPLETGSRGMRVYAVRMGDVGVAAICYGTEEATLSEACDRVVGSLEVLP
ncbi:MAG: hypothetical protein ABIK09_20130 [Pseudomonadota bacterium]